MARPRKSGKRLNGRLSRAAESLAERNTPPADHVIARRELFAFVVPTKGPEGRTGTIDQDICDGIGQLHALGLLDSYNPALHDDTFPHRVIHPHDPLELRDRGRDWRDGFLARYPETGFKVSSFERRDKSVQSTHETKAEREFMKMDPLVTGWERSCLMGMLIDPVRGSWPLGEKEAPWVRGFVQMGLLERGKLPDGPMRFPDACDRAKLEAVIRGLQALVGQNVERKAA